MAAFKVVIVGGGIAGLCLANILERYEIDFVVLEKHKNIAPQLGAVLGMLPHGIRIFDQLGLYEELTALCMPTNFNLLNFGPDGKKLGKSTPFGYLMESLFGYAPLFLERRQILELLYNNLRDNSKIRVATEVTKIDEINDSVVIELKDGSTVRGDILVGADGVHSRIREEIWRIADKETQGQYNSARLRDCEVSVSCNYRCMFGITTRPKEYPGGDLVKSYHRGRSYLLVDAPDNKLFFFAFRKNPKMTVDHEVQRYTQQDFDALADELSGDVLFDHVTFGDVLAQVHQATLVPLEEFVLDKCFYKRAILIGDSFHKLNPLGAIGGNIALESAGILADLLKSAIDSKPDMSNETIHKIFTALQKKQKPRSRVLMEQTKATLRIEALENPLFKFLRLGILNHLGVGDWASILASIYSPAQALKYLPKDYKIGCVLPDEEVKANPHDRPCIATRAWACLFLSFTLLGPLLSRYYGASENQNYESCRLTRLYIFTITLAVTGFWAMESYRPNRSITPLASPVPYILGSEYLGWHIVIPIYFAVYILLSKNKPFYYPTPRALNPSVAKSLPVALSIIYASFFPFIVQLMGVKLIPEGGHINDASEWVLTAARFGLLIGIYGFRSFYKGTVKGLDVVQLHFQTRDLKSLRRFFGLSFFFSGIVHILLLRKFLTTQVLADMSTVELFQIVSLGTSIIFWCIFTVWDMRRVDLTNVSLLVTLLCAVTGSIVVGPAAVLAALWWWREAPLESGRHKK
ncbi:hypothetical protein N7456_000542 [Penicillium angulare]|uniref:FAD-binding domain-containing protein n=1 Tax=Penicillium angulare TaxID=116970 RepID=A0A9W9KSB3_9EURO|nr:hypothetical protein N7456_000542 [Penicillium angulare]